MSTQPHKNNEKKDIVMLETAEETQNPAIKKFLEKVSSKPISVYLTTAEANQ